jgi:hypothetical protein
MMSLIANNIDYNLKQLSINEFLIDESSKKQHTVKLNYNFIENFFFSNSSKLTSFSLIVPPPSRINSNHLKLVKRWGLLEGRGEVGMAKNCNFHFWDLKIRVSWDPHFWSDPAYEKLTWFKCDYFLNFFKIVV